MSKKTAAAVGKELLKDGVPEDAIFVAGFGKENPIKPTKDGVLALPPPRRDFHRITCDLSEPTRRYGNVRSGDFIVPRTSAVPGTKGGPRVACGSPIR
jgi:hypothetical protein